MSASFEGDIAKMFTILSAEYQQQCALVEHVKLAVDVLDTTTELPQIRNLDEDRLCRNEDCKETSQQASEDTNSQGKYQSTEKESLNASEAHNTVAASTTQAFCPMGADLLVMYHARTFADVVVVAKERRFYAHRCVLMARSDYFHAMLGGDWAESSAKEVILQGCVILHLGPDIHSG